jgi:hypothetical protein
MTKNDSSCNFRLLSRFLDRELESDEYVRVRRHLEHCEPCQREYRDNEFISSFIKIRVEEALSRVTFQGVEEKVLSRIRAKRGPWWIQLKNLCLSKRFYVPAAAMAAIVMMFFHLATIRTPVSGPSAIINSLEGNYASVMILETQKSRQTILWIHEASDVWDNNGEPTDQTGLWPFSTKYCLDLFLPRLAGEGVIDTVHTC